jgi:hypothetical protein
MEVPMEAPPENRKARAGGSGLDGSDSANQKSSRQSISESSAAAQGGKTSKWRQTFKVHPAADVFPMMSDEELAELGKDIKANCGLTEPIVFGPYNMLLDGRNRLEAAERIGYKIRAREKRRYSGHPVAFIISANLKRRHMTKGQIADAIVAPAKIGPKQKPDQLDPVSKKVCVTTECGIPLWETTFDTVEEWEAAVKAEAKKQTGGRGKRSPVKARALEINKSLPKEDQVSEPTIKRAIAKAEGKTPRPRRTKQQIAEEKHRIVMATAEGLLFWQRIGNECSFSEAEMTCKSRLPVTRAPLMSSLAGVAENSQ